MKIVKRFDQKERTDILEKSQKCLWTSEGEAGRKYLLEDRGISESTLKKFKIGYIPAYIKHQLRGRVIFPMFDPSENLIALSSRIVDGPDLLPKYWHESYEKSFYLYGVEQSKFHMEKWKFATIVEGQFDVLQLHDKGWCNTVGLCSTYMTDIQLAIILRYCEEIVLLLDKDSNRAGQRGASKASKVFDDTFHFFSPEMTSEYCPKIAVVEFEEDTDPDEFVRKNGITPIANMIKSKIVEMRTKYECQYT